MSAVVGQSFIACVNGTMDTADLRGRHRWGRRAGFWPPLDKRGERPLCRITRMSGSVITEYQWRCMVPVPCYITSYVITSLMTAKPTEGRT